MIRTPCFHALYWNDAQYLRKFLDVWGKYSTRNALSKYKLYIVNHSCSMENNFYLISRPWKYVGRGITWSDISWARLSYFHNVQWHFWGWACKVHNVISLSDWNEVSRHQMQHQGKVSIAATDLYRFSNLSAFLKNIF